MAPIQYGNDYVHYLRLRELTRLVSTPIRTDWVIQLFKPSVPAQLPEPLPDPRGLLWHISEGPWKQASGIAILGSDRIEQSSAYLFGQGV